MISWLLDQLIYSDDFVRRVQREIRHSDVIIEIERKVDASNISSDLEKIRQEVFFNLRQEIYEEISSAQVELKNALESRLQEFDGRIRKLESNSHRPIQSVTPATASNDLVPIQNAIKQMQTDQQRMELRLRNVETGLNSSRSTIVPFGGSSALQDEIERIKQENSALKKQISLQEQRLGNLEKQNAAITRQLTVLQSQLEQLIGKDIAISPVPQSPIKPAPYRAPRTSVISSIQPVQPQEIPWIKSFSLSRPAKPAAYFRGDGATVKSKLAQSIQNMDGLITYLSQSRIKEPARTSFMKNLRCCMESLEKLYKKFDFETFDQEELSEEITNRFFKIINENLLDNILVAIYRGGKEATEYREFLKNVNSYLAKHGIYTKDIVPGAVIEKDMLSNIEPPITKQTSVPADSGKVYEVELLPYFMVYEDNDGELDAVRKRGRVVLLKYGE